MAKTITIACLLTVLMLEVSYPQEGYEESIRNLEMQEQEKKNALENVQKKIEQRKRETEKLHKQEVSIDDLLKKINTQLTGTEKKLKSLETQLASLKISIQKTKENLEFQQRETEKWNRIARRELALIYKQGLHRPYRNAWLIDAISANDFTGFIRRQKYLKSTTAQKAVVFQKFKYQYQKTQELKDSLESKESEISALASAQQQTRQNYNSQKEKQSTLLGKIKERRASIEREISSLEKSAHALQSMVDTFTVQKKVIITAQEKENYMNARRGKLPWPVEGKVVSRFGRYKHDELNAYVINRGIKISRESSGVICSVENGRVLYASDFRGYGNMIIVDHGNNLYSIYGYLSRFLVAANEAVTHGQAIAELKAGGQGNNPVLYFEIRLDGKPDDPMLWLRQM